MDKLVEYTKYTIALATGLLVYIPANFIPAKSDWEFWLILVSVICLIVSNVAGILVYARATKLLMNPPIPTKDQRVRFWAWVHQGALVFSFLVAGGFFLMYKVWQPTADIACTLQFEITGEPAKLDFPCKN